MKIYGLGDALKSFVPVQRKTSQQEGERSGKNADSRSSGKQDSSGEQEASEGKSSDNPQVDEEKLKAAIDAFGHGTGEGEGNLQAEIEGHGPGLRVTLKDQKGAVIRQMSGEEFIKLRDSTRLEPHARGRILDRKM